MKTKIQEKLAEKSVSFGMATGKVFQSTKNLSKKATVGMNSLVDKSKTNAQSRKLKKYNPLFPEQFKSDTFNLPNMIIIVDDAVRRGIDVCEGAIGWLGNQAGMEVLYLYDEAIPFSGIDFVPAATCDGVYYIDSFDRNKFVRIDCIFTKAHEERMAELKNIACLLGAKRCTIEMSESEHGITTHNKKADTKESYKLLSAEEKYERSFSNETSNRRSGKIEIEFSGSDSPKRPELKWFKHDDNINRLIDMRCNDNNAIKSETLRLSGASSATMSQKTAYSIDMALNKIASAKGNATMNSQADKEHLSELLYVIEF